LTLTWNGKRFDWVNVVYFAWIHLMALAAPFVFSWSALWVATLLWWVSGSAGIGFTYHRLLTHRGFRVPKWLEYLGTVCGMLMSEGGAITWVAMHRIHHAQSDRPGQDLHTPKDGFWWSHFGWIICEHGMDPREMERRYAPELVADSVHRVLNRIHVLPNVLLGLALFALGGWSWLVWGMFVRLVVGLNTTWFVNSATHTWGYRTFETNEDSRNLWWVGLLAWGEGWHNNHHAFQRSARHGLAWWELDANFLLIRALGALGLVSDIQLLPKNAERFRISHGSFARPRELPCE
jgi:stearoyl-CoA desaturase (delta-9 desaturase)